jgi:hypothetical protein
MGERLAKEIIRTTKISIRTGDEFQRLLSALADELLAAQFHFKLYQDLIAARPEYVREFSQAPTFWWLILRANIDAVVLRLCKAYDQYGANPPLSLRNLLHTIDANMHLFDEPNFRERLKGNAFVDSLAATPRTPDTAQLQKDLLSASNTDPLVKKLTIWRSNFYAHRSATHALDAAAFEKQYPLAISDIETLLTRGIDIVNRYSGLFIATYHATSIMGQDDYMSVLNAVRKDLEAREKRYQEEIKQINRKLVI